MKNKKLNNKGSVVLLIVLVIGALSILGTTVLSAALSNYKMRVANSDLKSNIYLTEAGFEEAYSQIYKAVEEATSSANAIAKSSLSGYNEEFFEEQVMLEEAGTDSLFIIEKDEAYIYDEEYIKGLISALAGEEFEKVFIEKIKLLVDVNGKFKSSTVVNEEVYIKNENKDIFNNTLQFNKKGTLNDYTDDVLTVYIASSYDGNTSRNAEVYLDIKVPIYGEPYTISYNSNLMHVNPLWTKIISTDENVDISTNSNVITNGKIYAGNNLNIKDGADFTISKNIALLGNIDMSGNNTVSLNSLYLKNILLSGNNISLNINEDSTIYSGAYVNDDLEMRARNQVVTVNSGYYGFNDGSDALYNTSDQSSGIIINSPDIKTSSSIRFNDDIFLYGTSYINLMNGILYQTGESISVKGNYIAYTMPLASGSYRESNVDFEYKEPLTLVTRMKGYANELNVYERSAYFKEYFDEYFVSTSNNAGLSLENIDITDPSKIYALGKVIYNNSVSNQGGITLDRTIFDEKKNIHKVYTKTLGDLFISNTNSGIGSSNITVPNITILDDINFTNIQEINTNSIVAGSSIGLISSRNSGDINIDLTGNTKYVFIVTNGRVNITGNGTINGCIVAKNGVTLNGNVNLNYNERVVVECFAKYKWLEEAFKIHTNAEERSFLISSKLLPPADTIYTNVDYSSLLDFHDWKILY